MRNNRWFHIFILFFALSFSAPATAQSAAEDPAGYRPYDQHRAVSTCMQTIYLNRYTEFPAQENAFPLCQQRYLELTRTLSHDEFIRAKLQDNSQAVNPEQIRNHYYDILSGRPIEP